MASSNEGDNRATQGGVAAFSAAPESLQAPASRQLPALQTAPAPPMSDLSNVKVLRVAAAPLPQGKPGNEVTADTSLPPHAAEVAVAVNTAAAASEASSSTDSAITPIAKSLQQHRPSLLVIPPRRGRAYKPVQARTVPTATGTMAALDVAATPVLSPHSQARFAAPTTEEHRRKSSFAPLSVSVAPTASTPSCFTRVLYSASAVGVVMALMGAAGGQWNVGTICTGVLTTLAGFFGLLGLSNLSAEVEARKQAKQGQRGQMELLLSGCMMVFAGTGFMLLLVSGVDESHLSTDTRCYRRAMSILQALAHSCSDNVPIDVLQATMAFIGLGLSATAASMSLMAEHSARKASKQVLDLKIALTGQLSDSNITSTSMPRRARTSLKDASTLLRFQELQHRRLVILACILQAAMPAFFLQVPGVSDASWLAFATSTGLSCFVAALTVVASVTASSVLLLSTFVLQLVAGTFFTTMLFVAHAFDSGDARMCRLWRAANPAAALPSTCTNVLENQSLTGVAALATVTLLAVCAGACCTVRQASLVERRVRLSKAPVEEPQ